MQHLNLCSQLDRSVEPPFSARQATWAVAVCVSVMLVVYAVLLVTNNAQYRDLETQRQQQKIIANELTVLRARKAKLEQDETLAREISSLQNNIKFRRRLLASIEPNNTVNTAANSAVMKSGFANHLTSLARQHIDGLWFTEIQLLEGGQKLALLGRTQAPEYVPRYLQKLAGEPIFSGHQFRVFRMSTPAEHKHLLDFELRANEVGQP